MEKSLANQIITRYTNKIFGFAISKTLETDKAHELAQRITLDVYTSLLKADDIHNIDGYVYRIAQNVYARYVVEDKRGRHVSLDSVNATAPNDFTLQIENDEIYHRLRRQISYLCKIQREVIVMYYFDKLRQAEIAKRLNITPGTVKWHLFEARNQLKGGISKMEINQQLKPIRFDSLWHSGSPAPDGKETGYYLGKLIAQNIAYAAYWQPKTITEIAGTLGVPAAFIEDEVAHLEAYGFLDKLPKGKYQTNVFISNPASAEQMEQLHELRKQAAKKVCELYVPSVIAFAQNVKNVYTPKNDLNFLSWAVVTYACLNKFGFAKSPHDTKYFVRRKDGGAYIAGAVLSSESECKLNFDLAVYTANNNMIRGWDNSVHSWQIKTYYDTRDNNYEDNLCEDYQWLYDFLTGQMPKTEAHADKFKRLYDKGYLAEDGNYVNMVVVKCKAWEFRESLPTPPKELKQVNAELSEKMFELDKNHYPSHMHELLQLWCGNALADQQLAAYILAQLVEDGVLKPLTDVQKAAVNTIMFCDQLPK